MSEITSIAIRPYLEPGMVNFGLEKYGAVMHDGCRHDLSMAYIERNGNIEYLNGLNEHADYIMKMDEDKREAEQKEIRKTVARLEYMFNKRKVDPEAEDFWEKCAFWKPDNIDFWKRLELSLTNDVKVLNPEDKNDLLLICAIKGGGFPEIAESFDKARNMPSPPKFHLDNKNDTADAKVELKRLAAKAQGILSNLDEKNKKKLFYIVKVISMSPTNYRNSTPGGIIFDDIDQYLEGKGFEKSKRLAIEKFIKLSEENMEYLKIRAIIKDASMLKMLVTKNDYFIYDVDSQAQMGRTVEEVAAFLGNPLNESILKNLRDKVEKYWNK